MKLACMGLNRTFIDHQRQFWVSSVATVSQPPTIVPGSLTFSWSCFARPLTKSRTAHDTRVLADCVRLSSGQRRRIESTWLDK